MRWDIGSVIYKDKPVWKVFGNDLEIFNHSKAVLIAISIQTEGECAHCIILSYVSKYNEDPRQIPDPGKTCQVF